MDGTCERPPQNYTADQCLAYVPKSDVQHTSISPLATDSRIISSRRAKAPSLPAHQFLLSGTSAPLPFNDANDPYLQRLMWSDWPSSRAKSPAAENGN